MAFEVLLRMLCKLTIFIFCTVILSSAAPVLAGDGPFIELNLSPTDESRTRLPEKLNIYGNHNFEVISEDFPSTNPRISISINPLIARRRGVKFEPVKLLKLDYISHAIFSLRYQTPLGIGIYRTSKKGVIEKLFAPSDGKTSGYFQIVGEFKLKLAQPLVGQYLDSVKKAFDESVPAPDFVKETISERLDQLSKAECLSYLDDLSEWLISERARKLAE